MAPPALPEEADSEMIHMYAEILGYMTLKVRVAEAG